MPETNEILIDLSITAEELQHAIDNSLFSMFISTRFIETPELLKLAEDLITNKLNMKAPLDAGVFRVKNAIALLEIGIKLGVFITKTNELGKSKVP